MLSIKVECVNVKLLDDVSIGCNFTELRAPITLLSVGEQPLASRGILFGGVEKAPRAGLGDNPNRPALCRSRSGRFAVWMEEERERRGRVRFG